MTPTQIHRLRKSLGLTQDAFAAELGFDGKHRNVLVHKWEAGITKPSHLALKVLERMAKAENVR
jgi:DNA-binding transcriptional regulator YiaG